MKLNGDFYILLDERNELICIVRLEQTCHILDAYGVCAHFLKLLCVFRKAFVRMNGACGIAYRRLNMTALFYCRVDGGFEVSGVVERVENSEYINAVCNGFLNEIFHDIVRIVAISEDILTAEKHLELCIFNLISYLAESFPRVLIEEAQAGIKCGAAPCFKRIVADLVHLFENGEHLLRRHSCGDERLVSVTQDCFANFNFSHDFILSLS